MVVGEVGLLGRDDCAKVLDCIGERIVDANISCGTEVYLWQGLLVQRHIDALLNKFMNDMCTS